MKIRSREFGKSYSERIKVRNSGNMSTNVKLEIRPFDGNNWSSWKFQILMLLRTHTGALDAVEGILKKPIYSSKDATPEELSKYKTDNDAYQRIESTAFYCSPLI